MKTKFSVIALVISFALASAAQANLVLTADSPFKPSDESPSTLESEIGARLGNPNLIDALRVDGQASGTTFDNGVVHVLFNNTAGGQTATITYDLTGSPSVTVVGIFVFGGNLGGNLYTATADRTVIGFGTVNAPLAGNSGSFADISHIDFFVQPTGGGNNVPDGGVTVTLLGGALGGLALMRRFGMHSSAKV
ncbi:MAG: hypothetical protein H0T95_03025 [Chthoniobacterales bacterium]|nr:hypothetical protein [Chthoniobacterales bacterium]